MKETTKYNIKNIAGVTMEVLGMVGIASGVKYNITPVTMIGGTLYGVGSHIRHTANGQTIKSEIRQELTDKI